MLVDNILPAMKDLDNELEPGELMAQAVELNVRWTVNMILESPEGKARQAEGVMKCIGAIYEIETGRVRFLE
jgi:carbonic anhydrase